VVTISILYPNRSDGRFDLDYYLHQHMPRAVELLSGHPGYRGVSVLRGIGGGAPGAEPAYIAMCHYQFDSLDQFLAAFSANSAFLQGDMPNYTDMEAIIQISEVVLSQ
jgi:uncharacterized protein (TIGR02118 family)